MIYLDNAATSYYKPYSVKLAVLDAINNFSANPGRSGHLLSNRVAEAVYDTRESIKDFFNATNYEVVFTKNCTEALNLAIFGFLTAGDHVICTTYDHNSILRAVKYLETKGIEITIIDCEMSNLLLRIEKSIRLNTKLVIVTHISNVTGEVCDIESIGKFCTSHDIKLLVDGAQSSGHIDIDLINSNVDMFTFAGHKGLLSATGVGGLIVKPEIRLKPLMYGGTGTDSDNLSQPIDYPEGFEAGTLPTMSILSLKAGIDFLKKNFEKIKNNEENLSKYTYFSLKKLEFLKIYSKKDSKNVFSFNVGNLDSRVVANELNEKYSICVRAGLHCAPLIHNRLDQMKGSVRVSLDYKNTKEEIDYLCKALTKIFHEFV